MTAKIRKGDLVEVVRGRSSDEKKFAERDMRRAAEDLELLKPGDKGKQERVTKVLPVEGTVLVEGVNLKTHHARQGQNRVGSIETVEAPISLTKIALAGPDTKQCVRVGFHEDVVERDDRTRKVCVRVTRSGVTRGIEQGRKI